MERNKKIEFASTTKIEKVEDIADDLLRVILDYHDAYFISDCSSLFEFPYEEKYQNKTEVFVGIKVKYGVDVSDICDGNIAQICERIKFHRK
jgi:hypothetical protein